MLNYEVTNVKDAATLFLALKFFVKAFIGLIYFYFISQEFRHVSEIAHQISETCCQKNVLIEDLEKH